MRKRKNKIDDALQCMTNVRNILSQSQDQIAKLLGLQISLLIPLVQIQDEIQDAPSLQAILECVVKLNERMLVICEGRVKCES